MGKFRCGYGMDMEGICGGLNFGGRGFFCFVVGGVGGGSCEG